MDLVTHQKDLQARYRHGLNDIVSLLSIVHAVPDELRNMLKNDAFEKPNQVLFIHLSYYLVCILDPNGSSLLQWPLYDKKSEHTYRTEFVKLISNHVLKGISPVMASHLVNAGGFKVTRLMFQLASAALRKAVQKKSKHTEKIVSQDLKTLKENMTVKFLQEESHKIRLRMNENTKKWFEFKNKAVRIADICHESLVKVNEANCDASNLLENAIDSFMKLNNLPKNLTSELESLKDSVTDSRFIEKWDETLDEKLATLEHTWNTKTQPLEEAARQCENVTKSLVLRQTLKDRSSYTIEFNPETDCITTEYLESEATSQQIFILKNIVVNNKLMYPNLIRAYAVALNICFKGAMFDANLSDFNVMFGAAMEKYGGVLANFKDTVSQVHALEKAVQAPPDNTFNSTCTDRDCSDLTVMEIPAIPDLMFKDDPTTQSMHHKMFTPLHMNKVKFRMTRNSPIQDILHPRLFETPLVKEKFLKNIASYNFGHEFKANILDVSKMNRTAAVNETINDCSAGFTKQQINRLLSTRLSSSKKFKSVKKQNASSIKRNKLFNDTIDESYAVYKSHSSPNLLEIGQNEQKNRLSLTNFKARKLYSIVQEEHSHSFLNIPGITEIEENSISNQNTPKTPNLEDSRNRIEAKSMPEIKVLSHESYNLKSINFSHKNHRDTIETLDQNPSESIYLGENFDQDLSNIPTSSKIDISPEKSSKVPKKRNSIDRILERYQKVRVSAIPIPIIKNTPVSNSTVKNEYGLHKKVSQEVKISHEESPSEKSSSYRNIKKNALETNSPQKNCSTEKVSPTNPKCLPDLVSPNFNMFSLPSNTESNIHYLEISEENSRSRPRESLGTVLGVDNTFLDQFDLID